MAAAPIFADVEEALAAGKLRKASRRLKGLDWRVTNVADARRAVELARELAARSSQSARWSTEELLRRYETKLRDLEWRDVAADLRVVRLNARLERLLGLVLADIGHEDESGLMALFVRLASFDKRGAVTVRARLEERFRTWERLLVDGYVRGYRAFEGTNTAPLMDFRQEIERTLKSVAVDLLTRGAEVRGLAEDAVPIVAYALVHEHLPAGVVIDVAESEDQLNDALLSKADAAAEMSPEDRSLFLSLYRLSFLLGISQRYTRQLGIEQLTVT